MVERSLILADLARLAGLTPEAAERCAAALKATARSLIGDTGELGSIANILPVERRFITERLGIVEPRNVAELLDVLGTYQFDAEVNPVEGGSAAMMARSGTADLDLSDASLFGLVGGLTDRELELLEAIAAS